MCYIDHWQDNAHKNNIDSELRSNISSGSNWDVIFSFEWLNTKVLLEINKKILIEKIAHWISSSKFNGIVLWVYFSRFNRICI